jgi:hypothetical protein
MTSSARNVPPYAVVVAEEERPEVRSQIIASVRRRIRRERHSLAVSGLLLMASSCGGETSENARGNGGESAGAPIDAPDAPSDAMHDTSDDALCAIHASNYDQTCSDDSDCVTSAGRFAINFSILNYCSDICLCSLNAINKNAADQYLADISSTPFGSGSFPRLTCSCTDPGGPCCRGGMCTLDCTPPIESGQGIVGDAAALD